MYYALRIIYLYSLLFIIRLLLMYVIIVKLIKILRIPGNLHERYYTFLTHHVFL